MDSLKARLDPDQPQAAGEQAPQPEEQAPAIIEEVVVEAISIDGMCGVY